MVRIALEVLLWAVSLLLITVFVRAGWAKFDESSGWARAFLTWGYPIWFRLLIGVLELAASLLLVWPRTAAYGAMIILVVMLGGMRTHLLIEHRPSRVRSELRQLTFVMACAAVGRAEGGDASRSSAGNAGRRRKSVIGRQLERLAGSR